MNNNVEGNDEYILISIFVRAQSTRFGIYRGTRIPCATRFRNASIHRRPIKAPRQLGPYIQNFLTREFNTRRRNFEFSEDAHAPFFLRVHLSSGFHPAPSGSIRFHPVPSGSIRFHPVPSGSMKNIVLFSDWSVNTCDGVRFILSCFLASFEHTATTNTPCQRIHRHLSHIGVIMSIASTYFMTPKFV